MMGGHEVTMADDSVTEFYVQFKGPKDSKTITFFKTLIKI